MSRAASGRLHAVEFEVEHFVDAGERDSNGMYDYYYEGDNYTFVEREKRLVVRIYADDLTTGFVVGLTASQLNASSMAVNAANHLRQQGVRTLKALGPTGTFEDWWG